MIDDPADDLELGDHVLGDLLEGVRGEAAPQRHHPLAARAADVSQREIATPPQAALRHFLNSPLAGRGAGGRDPALAIRMGKRRRRHGITSHGMGDESQ